VVILKKARPAFLERICSSLSKDEKRVAWDANGGKIVSFYRLCVDDEDDDNDTSSLAAAPSLNK